MYLYLLVQVIARYRLKNAPCKCNISLPQASDNYKPPFAGGSGGPLAPSGGVTGAEPSLRG